MPYASNADLPDSIKDALPEKAQSVFRGVVNAELEDGATEESAFAQAWTAVKNGWKQNESGDWVEKAEPTSGDVHVPGTEWRKKHLHVDFAQSNNGQYIEESVIKAGIDKMTVATILKFDDEARMVYGWASVISENGEPVVDLQNDIIEPQELVKATTEFMLSVRKAMAMHEGDKVGSVVHSFPLTAEFAKSLGVSCDREGWIVGVHVPDDATWSRVKSGELKAFSIGAQAIREEV